MTLTVIITSEGKEAQRIHSTAFKNEGTLQQFIHAHPECIPLYEIDKSIKLQVIAKEFRILGGRIDILGTDHNGEIYIIETKLYKNFDKRKVLAQVLDYGASMAGDYANNDVINKINSELVENNKIIENLPSDTIVANFKKNISEGRFKFIILMDKLDDGLKTSIKFINQHSDFKIYAVELRQYKYKEWRITMPKLFGAEISPIKNNSKRRKWDKKYFFDHANNLLNNQEQFKAIETLYEFAIAENATIRWGSGTVTGSFNVAFKQVNRRSVYSVWSNGKLTFQFAWLDTEKSKEYRKELQAKLSEIKGLKFPQDDKNVDIEIEEWVDKVDKIKKCLESVPRS